MIILDFVHGFILISFIAGKVLCDTILTNIGSSKADVILVVCSRKKPRKKRYHPAQPCEIKLTNIKLTRNRRTGDLKAIIYSNKPLICMWN